jgi:DNA-binding transcriptional regulator YiaG
MTPQQFRKARKHLGLSTAQMGRVLSLADPGRAIRRYEAGDRRVLGPVAVAMRYITTHGLDKVARAAAEGQ